MNKFCPKCGGEVIKKGWHQRLLRVDTGDSRGAMVDKKQRYKCKSCGHRTTKPLDEFHRLTFTQGQDGLPELTNVQVIKPSLSVRKVLVISDTHIEPESSSWPQYLNEEAFGAMLDYAKFYKPDTVIHLGDVGEFGSVNPFSRGKPKLLENRDLQDDIDVSVGLLNRIKTELPSSNQHIVTLGNHETRVERYFETNPQISKARSLNVVNMFEDVGWTVIPNNELYKLGKLWLFHGDDKGVYHARRHVADYGRNIMYGHHHTFQIFVAPFYDDPRVGMSVAGLCNRNPKWKKGKTNSWTHGFSTIDLFSNGNFTPDYIQIINGNFSRQGVVYGQ